jgi:alkylhydroperoxidase family enzyme
VAPGRLRQGGPGPWVVARLAGWANGTEPAALFLVLGRHRRLFWGWLHFAGRLMPGGRLARADTELAILRVAHLCDNAYELAHHRRLARRAGLDGAAVEQVLAEGPAADGWTPRQRAILAAVDALHHDRDIDDATWAELQRHVDERQCLELCQLVGHYQMLATTIRALRIPVDRPRPRSQSLIRRLLVACITALVVGGASLVGTTGTAGC